MDQCAFEGCDGVHELTGTWVGRHQMVIHSVRITAETVDWAEAIPGDVVNFMGPADATEF